MNRSASQAGPSGPAPTDWPSGTGLAPVPGRANLLVFAHPKCPCTRATLHELSVLMARARTALSVRVLLFAPARLPANWGRGGLQAKAAAIPGVEVLADVDGVEAARFAAQTSGWTLLYDADGRLAFAGGITAARGHEGDNAGLDSVLERLNGRPSTTPSKHASPAGSPVFGCGILTADQFNRTAGGTR